MKNKQFTIERNTSFSETVRANAKRYIDELDPDVTWVIDIRKGSPRKTVQNRLAFRWYRHIGEKMGHTTEYVHRFVKLTFGVPILVEVNQQFAEAWERGGRYFSFKDQMAQMEFCDVTSILKVAEFAHMLSQVEHYYRDQGIHMPKIDDEYYRALGYKRKAS